MQTRHEFCLGRHRVCWVIGRLWQWVFFCCMCVKYLRTVFLVIPVLLAIALDPSPRSDKIRILSIASVGSMSGPLWKRKPSLCFFPLDSFTFWLLRGGQIKVRQGGTLCIRLTESGLPISVSIEEHVQWIRQEKGELATESVHRMKNFTVSFGSVLI